MSNSNKITIRVLNNDGGGFAENASIVAGCTAGEYVKTVVTKNPSDYNIHVNNQPVAESYKFAEGDRLTITPKKVAGA